MDDHREKLMASGAPMSAAARPFDREKDLATRRPVVGKEKEKVLTGTSCCSGDTMLLKTDYIFDLEAKKLNTNFSSGSYL